MVETRADGLAWRDARGRRHSALVKRSFSLAGHRTSVALEEEFWSALGRIAAARGQTLSSLVGEIDTRRSGLRPLASELRVLALTWHSESRADG